MEAERMERKLRDRSRSVSSQSSHLRQRERGRESHTSSRSRHRSRDRREKRDRRDRGGREEGREQRSDGREGRGIREREEKGRKGSRSKRSGEETRKSDLYDGSCTEEERSEKGRPLSYVRKSEKRGRGKSKERKKHSRRRRSYSTYSSSSSSSGIKKRKKRRKKEQRREENASALTNQWGKYGVIQECDQWSKKQEFQLWLMEVKGMGIEGLPTWEEKNLFSEYMEDYNTATLPHKKFYNLEEWERTDNKKDKKELLAPSMFDDEKQRIREIQVIRDQRRAHALHAAYQDIKADVDKADAMKQQKILENQMKLLFRMGQVEKAHQIRERLKPSLDEDYKRSNE